MRKSKRLLCLLFALVLLVGLLPAAALADNEVTESIGNRALTSGKYYVPAAVLFTVNERNSAPLTGPYLYYENGTLTVHGNLSLSASKYPVIQLRCENAVINIPSGSSLTISATDTVGIYGGESGITLTGGGDLKVSNSGTSNLPAVAGSLNTSNYSGSIDISCKDKNSAIAGNANLVTSGGSVSLSSGAYPAVAGNAVISANGDVSITGSEHMAVYGDANITSANGSISISANSDYPAIGGTATLNAAYDITLKNNVGCATVKMLTASSQNARVTVSTGKSSTASPAIAAGANITAKGDIVVSDADYAAIAGNVNLKSLTGGISITGTNPKSYVVAAEENGIKLNAKTTLEVANFASSGAAFNQAPDISGMAPYTVKAGSSSAAAAVVKNPNVATFTGNAYVCVKSGSDTPVTPSGPINAIEIVGVAEPVCGASPVFYGEGAQGANYSVAATQWYNATDGKDMSSANKFEANKGYAVMFSLLPDVGAYFASNVTATVNGAKAEVKVNEDGSAAAVTITYLVSRFVDVPVNAYYNNAVIWASSNNIVSGTDDTHFNPYGVCTRANIVTFLWRAAGRPEPKLGVNPFSDVYEGSYCYKAILWAVETGITQGYGDGKFGTNDSVTRAQAMTFLWRASGEPGIGFTVSSPFNDVPITAYYFKPVVWAVQNGVTGGYGDGSFGSGDACTRAQIVTFMYRALSVNA